MRTVRRVVLVCDRLQTHVYVEARSSWSRFCLRVLVGLQRSKEAVVAVLVEVLACLVTHANASCRNLEPAWSQFR